MLGKRGIQIDRVLNFVVPDSVLVSVDRYVRTGCTSLSLSLLLFLLACRAAGQLWNVLFFAGCFRPPHACCARACLLERTCMPLTMP